MTLTLKVLLLAAIQGLTEIFPVSSSGHLVLAKHFLHLQTSGATLEVALHAGTLLSIMVYYRRRIALLVSGCVTGGADGLRYAGALVVGCIPAGLVGVLFQDAIERTFERPHAVAVMLMITGLFVLTVRWAKQSERSINLPRALGIGLAQAVSILPGISRSGSTIGMARHLGVAPEKAAEFSFLMSIPLIAGAIALKAAKLASAGGSLDLPLPALAAGVAVAAVVGYVAVATLVRTLSSGRFWWFGIYSLLAGALSLIALR